MMITSVTLPCGTAAVVHTSSLGWYQPLIEQHGLSALYRAVLDELHSDASCKATLEHDGGVVVESLPGDIPGVLAYALALCSASNCVALAASYEKEFDGPHPALDYERAWARKQAAVDELDDTERDLVQDYHSAEIIDLNLHWLQQSDPDAARIFRPGCFTDSLLNLAHPVPSLAAFDLGQALEQYAAAKRDEGRMDRYGALFAGTADFQWDAFLPADATTEGAR
ncbi:hypothetical protein [Streptomyces sp. VB1]|uniref:hypothetical protein n=1 Tax=Streptomyces sp. VB1 TaxID=2986803 RepID=UPI002241920D|nr:hypothetical protein [Streptomyces sp. VB1]UZI34028.1 hypothetical protein OH133_38555 [Streptomyces sp. VB1]